MVSASRRISLLILTLVCFSGTWSGCRREETPKQPSVHLNVVMKKYAVEPAEIRVKQGDLVMLHVTTPDVQHGFEVTELGINEPVNPGKAAVISFKAEKKGEFPVVCSIICGAGHDDMTGKIIVE